MEVTLSSVNGEPNHESTIIKIIFVQLKILPFQMLVSFFEFGVKTVFGRVKM